MAGSPRRLPSLVSLMPASAGTLDLSGGRLFFRSHSRGCTGLCLDVQVCVWMYRSVFGYTGSYLDVQVRVWMYRFVFGCTGLCLDVQVCV